MIFLIKVLQFKYWIIFSAPPGIALALMRFGGWIIYSIARMTSFKKTVARNVETLFPQSNGLEIADKLLKTVSYSIFELLCQPYFKAEHFKRLFAWEGMENLNRALEHKKGVLLLTLHAGNYELIPAAVGNLGYKMNSILRSTDDPIFKILNESRRHQNVNIINVSEQDMYRETIQLLGKNELVGTLADTGALEGRHVMLNFLGKEVPAATGWLTLAQRAETMVVPVLTRKEGGKNVITLYEPFSVTKDTREPAMQKAHRIFEDFVRQHPDQWGIFLNSYEVKRMVEGK